MPSILDPRVSGGSHEGLLAVYSLSKQSNLAGTVRRSWPAIQCIMANLVNSRKHAGMIVPYPVQEAMRVALGDDAHVQAQKDLYRGRRERIVPALEGVRAGHPRIPGRALPVVHCRGSHLGHRRAGLRSGASWWAPVFSTAMQATASSAWR